MANDNNFVPVRGYLRRTSGANIEQQHAPDTQAYAEGDDGDDMLPMGNSTEGMFGNVTGGADLDRGYLPIGNDIVNAPPPMPRDGWLDTVPSEQNDGFAGRPGGWER